MPHRLCLVALALLACAPWLRADVRLPALFSDGMVVQRDAPLPVWGWAEPGEEVTVTLGAITRTTKAGADGRWRVDLPPQKAGAAVTITVKARNTVTIRDV